MLPFPFLPVLSRISRKSFESLRLLSITSFMSSMLGAFPVDLYTRILINIVKYYSILFSIQSHGANPLLFLISSVAPYLVRISAIA